MLALAAQLLMAGSFGVYANDQGARRMLEEIAADFRDTAYLTGLKAMSPAVATAMAGVPRDEFVQPGDREVAFVNRPLSIGHGQTISQPFIVALMTELAALEPGDSVLEIGTGSGYQAAVLAMLADKVYTIEIVAALATRAQATLARLAYDNVSVRTGDGNHGWPEQAPFDAIVVTAAGHVPPALIDQLKPGARMVIPVGAAAGAQELVVIEKLDDVRTEQRTVLPVLFVPLTGDN